jgi:hypothetical protein
MARRRAQFPHRCLEARVIKVSFLNGEGKMVKGKMVSGTIIGEGEMVPDTIPPLRYPLHHSSLDTISPPVSAS